MKARDIVGKTVKSIQQERFWDPDMQRWIVAVAYLEFTDGTAIAPHALETCDTPEVGFQLIGKGRKLNVRECASLKDGG